MAKQRPLSIQSTPALPAGARASRTRLVWILGAAAVLGLAASVTPAGRTGLGHARSFLEFYTGAVSLVALTISVMAGVATTDRLVLGVPQRMLLQALHRGMAVTSVVFLAVHTVLKIAENHASVLGTVVPFADGTTAVALGVVAAYLMLAVTWTGLIRGRFAGSAHPGRWRMLHVLAYVAWPLGLVHGLLAGRPAKPWVTVSYLLCGLFIVAALLVRAGAGWSRRPGRHGYSTTGRLQPVGRIVPAYRPALAALPGPGDDGDPFGPVPERAPARALPPGRGDDGYGGRPRPGYDREPAYPEPAVPAPPATSPDDDLFEVVARPRPAERRRPAPAGSGYSPAALPAIAGSRPDEPDDSWAEHLFDPPPVRETGPARAAGRTGRPARHRPPRAGGPALAPPRGSGSGRHKVIEEVTDDEYWAFLRGASLRGGSEQ